MEAFRRHSGALKLDPAESSETEILDAREQAHLLVDVGQEPSFDESVRLTAQLLDFPMAAISILGRDEQLFKARVGLDVNRTPIEHAFCAHTARQEGILLVPDATLDPRFQTNPLVTVSPGVRSYAGVPLSMPDGRVLGALCVLDTQPREVSIADRQTLTLLARQVSIQMQLEEMIARQAKDILDLRLARSELAYMAMHDPLTGLLNRRGIFDRLSENMTPERAFSAASPTTVLFIDLDRFKELNDTHGHQCGDRALATIARRIKNHIPDGAIAGRLGGDEFVVVLPGILGGTTEAQAMELASDLVQVISRPMGRDDLAVQLTPSIGIASSDTVTRASDLMIAADRAMYRAKESGGGRVSSAAVVRI